MEHDALVQDVTPGAPLRPATDNDAVLRINDDGTVTVAADTEVVEYNRHQWLRTPRLRGWSVVFENSPWHGMIRADMVKQGRRIPCGTQAQVNAVQETG